MYYCKWFFFILLSMDDNFFYTFHLLVFILVILIFLCFLSCFFPFLATISFVIRTFFRPMTNLSTQIAISTCWRHTAIVKEHRIKEKPLPLLDIIWYISTRSSKVFSGLFERRKNKRGHGKRKTSSKVVS